MIKKILSISFWISQLSKNHLNILLTLWFNFHFLPFRQAIKIPVFLYGKVKFIKADGTIAINGPVERGMITINKMKSAPCFSGGNTEFVLHKNGKIIFNGPAFIGCGCCLNINIGTLVLGQNITINNQNNIGCFNHIEIGDNSRIGHQNQIYDTNFHHTVDLEKKIVKKSNAPIIIGKRCWIPNRVTIMPNIKLPDYTIITSNSLVNKNVATGNYQIIGGIPAKLIKENMIRVWNNTTEERLHWFFKNEGHDYQLNSTDEI
jgi:acetyltransferase-like isoleucine patch superfamily enzyme